MLLISKTYRSTQELAEKVAEQFSSLGYKLEEGTAFQGVYGIGTPAMRALLGGFVKRNKFSVRISQTPNNEQVIELDKAMSGAMGGIIGVSKINDEFQRIQDLLSHL